LARHNERPGVGLLRIQRSGHLRGAEITLVGARKSATSRALSVTIRWLPPAGRPAAVIQIKRSFIRCWERCMSRQKSVIAASAAILALALACSKQSSAPTSPSATTPASAAAAADGSTLKAAAPSLVSPLNDAKLDDVATLT